MSFVLFSQAFSFLCLVATTILDSLFLFLVPDVPHSRDRRPNSLAIGASRSLWLLPAEPVQQGMLGLPPTPASLECQSPYESARLRVSDRYFTQPQVVLYIFVELVVHFGACWPGKRQNNLKNLPWFVDLFPCSYAFLLFVTSNFTSITRHIHNWASFLLWPTCFLLLGAISSCPPLFPSSILDTFRPVELIFWGHILLFYAFLEVLKASNPFVFDGYKLRGSWLKVTGNSLCHEGSDLWRGGILLV